MVSDFVIIITSFILYSILSFSHTLKFFMCNIEKLLCISSVYKVIQMVVLKVVGVE